jgi:ribonuclease HI
LALDSIILNTSPMKVATPHYLLFSESSRKNEQNQWRFVLQSIDGSEQLEATDEEAGAHGERLELLAVVRGLEAIDGPARVTLVTPSKYVNRGIAYGLDEWRANGWEWEHYGEMVPVKNRDLWQRVDRALQFHQVECRTWRFDLPHTSPSEDGRARAAAISPGPRASAPKRRALVERVRSAIADWLTIQRRALVLWMSQGKSRLFPQAWFQ